MTSDHTQDNKIIEDIRSKINASPELQQLFRQAVSARKDPLEAYEDRMTEAEREAIDRNPRVLSEDEKKAYVASSFMDAERALVLSRVKEDIGTQNASSAEAVIRQSLQAQIVIPAYPVTAKQKNGQAGQQARAALKNRPLQKNEAGAPLLYEDFESLNIGENDEVFTTVLKTRPSLQAAFEKAVTAQKKEIDAFSNRKEVGAKPEPIELKPVDFATEQPSLKGLLTGLVRQHTAERAEFDALPAEEKTRIEQKRREDSAAFLVKMHKRHEETGMLVARSCVIGEILGDWKENPAEPLESTAAKTLARFSPTIF